MYVCWYCVYSMCGYFNVKSVIMDFISLSFRCHHYPLIFLAFKKTAVCVCLSSTSHALAFIYESTMDLVFKFGSLLSISPNIFECVTVTHQASQPTTFVLSLKIAHFRFTSVPSIHCHHHLSSLLKKKKRVCQRDIPPIYQSYFSGSLATSQSLSMCVSLCVTHCVTLTGFYCSWASL